VTDDHERRAYDDPLLAQLAKLPERKNAHDPAPAAREAFQNAFLPWHQRAFARSTEVVTHQDGSASLLARSIVPVFLAGVVVIYLLWALAAAFSLQG
jgi:hypothetical protein